HHRGCGRGSPQHTRYWRHIALKILRQLSIQGTLQAPPGCRTTHATNLCPLDSPSAGCSTPCTWLPCSRRLKLPAQMLDGAENFSVPQRPCCAPITPAPRATLWPPGGPPCQTPP